MCVILDEAYCEFNLLDDPDASVELLDRHPNLVLLRTFSKVYGLCGLRVGFALCGSEDLPRAVDQVRQPFFCNALAQAAAVEALAHQDAVTERVTRTIAERISVDERLRALGLDPADSQTNFCWFHLGEDRDEAEVMRGLRGARRARARRRRSRPRGRAARHLRHSRGKRALPGGACRGALKVLQLRVMITSASAATLFIPARARGRPTAPGDLARRFGLDPFVSGFPWPHWVLRRTECRSHGRCHALLTRPAP